MAFVALMSLRPERSPPEVGSYPFDALSGLRELRPRETLDIYEPLPIACVARSAETGATRVADQNAISQDLNPTVGRSRKACRPWTQRQRRFYRE